MKQSEKIRLIIRTRNGHQFLGEWKPIKRYNQLTGFGKPTPENLAKWRDDFNQSLKPGGANEHLTLKYYLQTPTNKAFKPIYSPIQPLST